MPRRPKTPCTQPGCPELTSGGRCAVHARQATKLRREAGNGVYGTSAWARVRKAYLYENPWCALCGAPSTVADHYPLSRKALVAQGVDTPDAPTHLRPLCTHCHNRETAQHQPGGWAAEHRHKR